MSKLASTFTCEICIEPALSTQQFQHENNVVHNFCVMCIGSYIQAKVEQNTATIHCPDKKCDITLDPVECQPLITNEIFVKLCDRLCESAIAGSNKYYCPYQQCSEFLIDECDGRTNRCKCPRCKRLFCYKCRIPWHAGYYCSESHQRRDSNEKKFGVLVEKMKWTRCPGCGQPIEHAGGCLSVICRCGRSFYHGRSYDHESGYTVPHQPEPTYPYLRVIAKYTALFFGGLVMAALVIMFVFMIKKVVPH